MAVRFADRCLAALVVSLPLAFLGEWLISRTHHRPLGAATFASLAVASLAVVSLAVANLAVANLAAGTRGLAQRLAWWLGAASAIGVLVRVVTG